MCGEEENPKNCLAGFTSNRRIARRFLSLKGKMGVKLEKKMCLFPEKLKSGPEREMATGQALTISLTMMDLAPGNNSTLF
jgi:hypothetical protein